VKTVNSQILRTSFWLS